MIYQTVDEALAAAISLGELPGPEIAGVYILRTPDTFGSGFVLCGEILYIGQAQNIRKRLATHPRLRQFREWDIRTLSIDVIPCGNRQFVESILISELKPRFNNTSDNAKRPTKKEQNKRRVESDRRQRERDIERTIEIIGGPDLAWNMLKAKTNNMLDEAIKRMRVR